MESDDSSPRREPGWPHWAEAISAALKDRGLSVNASADLVGVRNSTWKSWLDGEVPPRLSKLPAIADLSGISHAAQLDLGGALPPALSHDARSFQSAEEIRSVVARLEQVAAEVRGSLSVDPGALLASTLLEVSGPGVQVVLRRAFRGRRWPLHHSTYLGLYSDHVGLLDSGQPESILSLVQEIAAGYGARWREQWAHDWPGPQPQALLTIPYFERSRPAPADPVRPAPPSVLFVGAPYAYTEYAAAAFAESLNYGYRDHRYSVVPALGATETDTSAVEARTAWALNNLESPTRVQRCVWAVADHRVLPRFVEALTNAEAPMVVYVRSGDRLLERGAEVWHVDVAQMLAIRAQLDRTMEIGSWPAVVMQLDDDVICNSSGEVEADLVADGAMSLALDLWFHLGRRVYLPAPTQIQGRLRAEFDDFGAFRHGPRRPWVVASYRLPDPH